MKRFVWVMVIVGVVMAGCAKKEKTATAQTPARQFLVEGTVYLKQGDPRKAVESFAKSIQAAPDVVDGYFMLGETFLRLKQFPQATSVLSSAVRQFPDNGLVYYLLAVADQGQGKTVQALLSARKSVELFTAQGDREGAQKAAVLLTELVAVAKAESEQKMVENSAQDAQKAVASASAKPAPAGTVSAK